MRGDHPDVYAFEVPHKVCHKVRALPPDAVPCMSKTLTMAGVFWTTNHSLYRLVLARTRFDPKKEKASTSPGRQRN